MRIEEVLTSAFAALVLMLANSPARANAIHDASNWQFCEACVDLHLIYALSEGLQTCAVAYWRRRSRS